MGWMVLILVIHAIRKIITREHEKAIIPKAILKVFCARNSAISQRRGKITVTNNGISVARFMTQNYLIRLGSQVERQGIYVINPTDNAAAMSMGSTAFMMCVIGLLKR